MAALGCVMGRARVSAAIALLAVASALHCNPSNDKTPSSISQVYQSVTVTALEGDGGIRIDRVARLTSPDSLNILFEKQDYRLVEPGRSRADAGKVPASVRSGIELRDAHPLPGLPSAVIVALVE